MWKIFLPFVMILVLLTWATGLVIFWRYLRERWKRQAAEEKRRAEREAVESFHRLSAGVYGERAPGVADAQERKPAGKSNSIPG